MPFRSVLTEDMASQPDRSDRQEPDCLFQSHRTEQQGQKEGPGIMLWEKGTVVREGVRLEEEAGATSGRTHRPGSQACAPLPSFMSLNLNVGAS